MIWKHCILQFNDGYIPDQLGNIIPGEWQTVRDTFCRFTPWTDQQIALEGREVTRNEQRFAVPIPFSQFPKCTHAVIDGHRQKIKEVIDLAPRYTVIQVEIYKE